jgi:preprotein translocase subunit SecE
MAEKNGEKSALKRSWFQELKAEFHKIIWPDKDTLIKEAVAVIIIAVIIGIIVGLVDRGLIIGLNELKSLVSNMLAG